MRQLGLHPADIAATSALGATRAEPGRERLAALVDEYYPFVWRTTRRLGVPAADADDASQQVFLVLARKLDRVRPGSERRFVFQTALRVASDYRRARRRRREDLGDEAVGEPVDPGADPLEVVALRGARNRLDAILDVLPIELRAVFVLFELEESTMAEIAEITGLRPGTVASRLRRARAIFLEELAKTPEPADRYDRSGPR